MGNCTFLEIIYIMSLGLCRKSIICIEMIGNIYVYGFMEVMMELHHNIFSESNPVIVKKGEAVLCIILSIFMDNF